MPDDELMSKIILESRQIAQINQKLADQLHSSQEMAAKLKDDVARLQNRYSDHSSDPRMKFLEQSLEEKTMELGRLTHRLNEYEQALKGRDEHISLLQGDIAGHKSKLSNKTEIIGELGRTMQAREDEYAREKEANMKMADEVRQIREDLGDREERLKKLHSVVSLLEDRLKESAETISSFEKEKKELLSELGRARESNSNLSVDIRQSRKNSEVMLDDIRIKDRLLQETKRKQMERQKALTKLSAEIREMQERMRILDEANTEAIKKLHSSQTRTSALEEELAHQREINSRLQMKYEALLKMQEVKHATRIKEIIADHTQIQLGLKTELEVLRERHRPRKTEIPETSKIEEYQGFMEATPEEIMPMVRTAMDHGDSEEEIMQTLVTSGYEKKVIEKAIEKINSRA